MNWLVLAGAISLGLLIGSMVRAVFRQMTTLNAKALGSLISVMIGAGVLGLFHAISGSGTPLPQEVYTYPVGLLLGYVITALLEDDPLLLNRTVKPKNPKTEPTN